MRITKDTVKMRVCNNCIDYHIVKSAFYKYNCLSCTLRFCEQAQFLEFVFEKLAALLL